MTSVFETVQRVACGLVQCADEGERIAVPTHFIYPSRGSVTVYVSGAIHGKYIVSDGGGAVDTISSHGLTLGDTDHFLRPFCSSAGLRARDGVIYSPSTEERHLGYAMIVVAETAAQAAHHGVTAHRPKRKRDLIVAVRDELKSKFADEKIKQKEKLRGASSRQYSFDFAVDISAGRKLLIDTVLPDRNSVNAKMAANTDFARTKSDTYSQLIVYDESDEEWPPADLSFLQLAAPTISLSRLPRDLMAHVMQ